MSSNAIKISAIVLVILALILVFVAWRYGKSLEAHSRQQQAQQQQQSVPQSAEPTTDVVVATQPLPAQVKIEKSDVALVPVQIAPKGYLSNVKDAIGRVPMQDIDAGTPLTNRLFTGNNPLARNIPEGAQALSLRVDDVIGTGGFVKPGDHVDVLLYLRQQSAGPSGAYKVQTQARVLLKDALVLAYQDQTMPPPEDMKKKKEGNGGRSHQHTTVLAVPDADVTRVMLGASLGTLRLALLRQATPPAETSSVGAPATAASSQDIAVASTGSMAAAATTTTAATLKEMQAANNSEKPASAASTQNDKVITLKELGFISSKQHQEAQKARGEHPRRHYAPRVPVYRGDQKVEMVRP
ncbi:MAG: Flp pilus assembly protein CpaB [Sinobacteraceae bacterium]|nr:Flp pilus assembly protein CpaB [Nevskiaceae bacterium]